MHICQSAEHSVEENAYALGLMIIGPLRQLPPMYLSCQTNKFISFTAVNVQIMGEGIVDILEDQLKIEEG